MCWYFLWLPSWALQSFPIFIKFYGWSTYPPVTYPPTGLINHWFPFIRPWWTLQTKVSLVALDDSNGGITSARSWYWGITSECVFLLGVVGLVVFPKESQDFWGFLFETLLKKCCYICLVPWFITASHTLAIHWQDRRGISFTWYVHTSWMPWEDPFKIILLMGEIRRATVEVGS